MTNFDEKYAEKVKKEKREILETIDYYFATFFSPPCSRLMDVEKSKLMIDTTDEGKVNFSKVEEIFWKFMSSDLTFWYAEDNQCFNKMFESTEFWNYISKKLASPAGLTDATADAVNTVNENKNTAEAVNTVNENKNTADAVNAVKGRYHYLLDVCYPFYQDIMKEKLKCNDEEYWKDELENEKFIEINEQYLPIIEEKVIKNNCVLGNLNLAYVLKEKWLLFDSRIDSHRGRQQELENIFVPILTNLSKNNVVYSDALLGEFYFQDEGYKQAVHHLERASKMFDELLCCELASSYRHLSKFDLMTETCKLGVDKNNCSKCAKRFVKHFSKHIDDPPASLTDKQQTAKLEEVAKVCNYFHQAALEKDRFHFYGYRLDDKSFKEEVKSRKILLTQLNKFYKKYSHLVDFEQEYLNMMTILDKEPSGSFACSNLPLSRHNKEENENLGQHSEENERNVGQRSPASAANNAVKIAEQWATNVVRLLIAETDVRSVFLKESKSSLIKKRQNKWMNESTLAHWLSTEVARICYNFLFSSPTFYNWQLPLTF
jgi:hypothetical protein